MDILIKGVKMPKKGQYLHILIAENGEMSYEHVYYNSPRAGFTLHKSKAVALPEHGDLVSRDSIATALRDYLLAHFGERLDEDLSNAIYSFIAEAETIVEATE